MAGQRRGELRLRSRGGRGRLGGLGLALSLTLLAACGEGGPAGSQRPDNDDGTSGGGSGPELVVGTWRNVTLVDVPGDLQTWTTTWQFDDDGDCLQTVETESLVEGFPRVTERPCTFVAADFEIAVAFIGGGTLTIEYSFADFSPDQLILDGFEYDRIG